MDALLESIGVAAKHQTGKHIFMLAFTAFKLGFQSAKFVPPPTAFLITPKLQLDEWYAISLSLAESPQGEQVKKRMAFTSPALEPPV